MRFRRSHVVNAGTQHRYRLAGIPRYPGIGKTSA